MIEMTRSYTKTVRPKIFLKKRVKQATSVGIVKRVRLRSSVTGSLWPLFWKPGKQEVEL